MKFLKLISSGIALTCLSTLSVAETVSTPDSSQITTYQNEMRKVSMQFAQQLGGALKQEIQTKGIESAIDVCKQLAPKIANDLSNQTGWKVTRVGTKVRNPNLGMPDAWEQQVMRDFEQRANKGEDLSKAELIQIVTEPSGKYVRYVKPIQIQPLCLSCHGDTQKEIAPNVLSKLKVNYPNDHATGYKVGQLRGLISIKR